MAWEDVTWETRYANLGNLALDLKARRTARYSPEIEREIYYLIDQALETLDYIFEQGVDTSNPDHMYHSGRLSYMLEHIVWIIRVRKTWNESD